MDEHAWGAVLPFFLLIVPAVLAVFDLMATKKSSPPSRY